MKLVVWNSFPVVWEYVPSSNGQPARFSALLTSRMGRAEPSIRLTSDIRAQRLYAVKQMCGSEFRTFDKAEAMSEVEKRNSLIKSEGSLSVLGRLATISEEWSLPQDSFALKGADNPDGDIFLARLRGKPWAGCLLLTSCEKSWSPGPSAPMTTGKILRNGWIDSGFMSGPPEYGGEKLYNLATAVWLEPGQILGYNMFSTGGAWGNCRLWAYTGDRLIFHEGWNDVSDAVLRFTGKSISERMEMRERGEMEESQAA